MIFSVAKFIYHLDYLAQFEVNNIYHVQVTCLDGLSHDKTEKRVLRLIENTHNQVTKLCSNALALVKKLTTDVALTDEKSLVVHDFPYKITSISSQIDDPKIVLFSNQVH